MSTVERSGYRMEAGAQLLSTRYRQMRRLIADPGPTEQVRTASTAYGVLWDGQVHRLRMNSPVESAAEYCLRRFGREVLEYFVDPLCGSTYEQDPEDMSAVSLLFAVRAVAGAGSRRSDPGPQEGAWPRAAVQRVAHGLLPGSVGSPTPGDGARQHRRRGPQGTAVGPIPAGRPRPGAPGDDLCPPLGARAAGRFGRLAPTNAAVRRQPRPPISDPTGR